MSPRRTIARDSVGDTIVTETATPPSGPDAETRARDEAKLKVLHKQLKSVIDRETFYRTQAVLDAKFRAGTWGDTKYQWPEGVAEARKDQKRPCMTINRMPGFIRQVTNQWRAAHMHIQVNAVDDKADPKTAEVLQGMIRNIETQSFADRAYDMGAEKQAEIGRGYARLKTEWEDANGDGPIDGMFRQVIRIMRETNPLSVYVGPANQPDYSDAPFAIKVTDLDEVGYMEEFGVGKDDVPTAASAESMGMPGDETGHWFPTGKIRVVEWFNREPRGEKKRYALMDDGRVIEYPNEEQKKELDVIGAKILRDRWVQKKVMVWRKCDACHIRETTDWCTDQQPWTPFLGDELIVDGEVDYRGVVRDAKEAAQVYNVEVSALVENVGLGTKSPVVGYRGQFGAPDSKQRRAWETAHTTPHPFLEVEPLTIDEKPAPMPQPVTFEPPLEGVILAIRQSNEDYMSTAGFRDASLGERGPQESGKAILARQKQDELGSSHYLDNARYALCSIGVQLVKAIRVVYEMPQVVRITGTDERARRVMIFSGAKNDPRNDDYLKTHTGPEPLQTPDGNFVQPGQKIPFQLPKGVKEIYDIGVGRFDIEVQAGPSSGTRRQEAAEAMTQLLASLPPEIATKFLDLYFQMLDFPKAQQLAERAKMLLPPELQDEDDVDLAAIPPAVRQKMMMMEQQLKHAMEMLQQAAQEIKGEQAKAQATLEAKRIDADTRVKVAKIGQQTELLKTDAQLGADRAIAAIEAQIDQLKTLVGIAHEEKLAAHDAAHEVGMEHLRHAHGQEEAAAARADAVASAAAGDVVAPEPGPAGTGV